MHNYFAEKSANHYLSRLMNSVLSHNMRVVILGAKIPDRMSKSNKEHIKIIDMMLDNDASGAKDAMKNHISSAKNIALLLMK